MQINLTGQPINAKAAAKIGLVDAAVPKRQLENAARYYLLHQPLPHQPALTQQLLSYRLIRPCVAKVLYAKLEKKGQ